MCDVIREPPGPGENLFTYWREQPLPVEGEVRDMPMGDWMLRVRIDKVKDSAYKSGEKHVSMTVVG